MGECRIVHTLNILPIHVQMNATTVSDYTKRIRRIGTGIYGSTGTTSNEVVITIFIKIGFEVIVATAINQEVVKVGGGTVGAKDNTSIITGNNSDIHLIAKITEIFTQCRTGMEVARQGYAGMICSAGEGAVATIA